MKKEEVLLKIHSAIKKVESHSEKTDKIGKKLAPYRVTVSLAVIAVIAMLLAGHKALAIALVVVTPILLIISNSVKGKEAELEALVREDKALQAEAKKNKKAEVAEEKTAEVVPEESKKKKTKKEE